MLSKINIWIPFDKKIGHFACGHCIKPKKTEDFEALWVEETVALTQDQLLNFERKVRDNV